MSQYTQISSTVTAVQFNPSGNMWPPEEDHNFPPEVRRTTYGEVSRLLDTSGCSKQSPYWSWHVMGAVDTPRGTLIVIPGDWILHCNDATYIVDNVTFSKNYLKND